jgi:hypothetical protein
LALTEKGWTVTIDEWSGAPPTFTPGRAELRSLPVAAAERIGESAACFVES